MKKCFEPFVFSILFISMSIQLCSCKKEYTCHCVTVGASSGLEGDVKIKSKKSGSEACSSMNANNGSSITTCTLK